MTITEHKRDPGVSDLTPKAKTAFAAALVSEDKGDTAKSEKWLDKAIQFEESESRE